MDEKTEDSGPTRISVIVSDLGQGDISPITRAALEGQASPDFEVLFVGRHEVEQGLVPAGMKRIAAGRRGRSGSWNQGLFAAAGEVVAFLENGARPGRSWVADLIETYRREGPRCGAVGGAVIEDGVKSRPLSFRFGTVDGSAEVESVRIEPVAANPGIFRCLHPSNMSYRREVISSVGGFDESLPGEFAEFDACATIASAGYRVVQHGRAFVGAPPSTIPGLARRDWRDWFRARAIFSAKHGRPGFLARIALNARRWSRVTKDIAGHRRTLGLGRKDLLGIILRGLTGAIEGSLLGLTARRSRRPIRPDGSSEFLPYATTRPSILARPSTDPLRVALVCSHFGGPVNGVNMYTKLMAESLARLGHSVTVFRQDHYQNQVRPEGYDIVTVRPNGRLFQSAVGEAIAAHAKPRAFDVVEGPLWRGETCAVGLLAPYPVVVRLITPVEVIWKTMQYYTDHPAVRQKYQAVATAERIGLSSASGVIAISRAVWETTEKSYELTLDQPGRRAEVIPLGLPDARAVPIEPFHVPRPSGPVFLSIGRLEARKAPLVLAEAFARACQSLPDAALWLVGADVSPNDGFFAENGITYVDKMRQICGIHAEKIRYFDEISEGRKNALVAACDVLVVSSLYESFGLTLLEAMRFGKPVVATRTGGIVEVVDEGVTGLLAEPDSPGQLAEAMIAMGRDAELRARCGAAGLARFRERFDLERCAQRSANFYRQVIADHDRFS